MEPEGSQMWPQKHSPSPFPEPDRIIYSHLRCVLILLFHLLLGLISGLFTSSLSTETTVNFSSVQYVPHDPPT